MSSRRAGKHFPNDYTGGSGSQGERRRRSICRWGGTPGQVMTVQPSGFCLPADPVPVDGGSASTAECLAEPGEDSVLCAQGDQAVMQVGKELSLAAGGSGGLVLDNGSDGVTVKQNGTGLTVAQSVSDGGARIDLAGDIDLNVTPASNITLQVAAQNDKIVVGSDQVNLQAVGVVQLDVADAQIQMLTPGSISMTTEDDEDIEMDDVRVTDTLTVPEAGLDITGGADGNVLKKTVGGVNWGDNDCLTSASGDVICAVGDNAVMQVNKELQFPGVTTGGIRFLVGGQDARITSTGQGLLITDGTGNGIRILDRKLLTQAIDIEHDSFVSYYNGSPNGTGFVVDANLLSIGEPSTVFGPTRVLTKATSDGYTAWTTYPRLVSAKFQPGSIAIAEEQGCVVTSPFVHQSYYQVLGNVVQVHYKIVVGVDAAPSAAFAFRVEVPTPPGFAFAGIGNSDAFAGGINATAVSASGLCASSASDNNLTGQVTGSGYVNGLIAGDFVSCRIFGTGTLTRNLSFTVSASYLTSS